MHFTNTLSLGILALAHCLAHACACATPAQVHKRQEGEEVEYPYADMGADTPADPATTSYFINHLSINVRNATESIKWYSNTFGMRLMFKLHVSKHFTITYMGHAHGGRNGTGYQTAAELIRDKNNAQGYIEFVEVIYPGWDLPSGLRVPNTFSHIGMVVPNVNETHERLVSQGANIIKAPYEPFVLPGWFADGSGFPPRGDEFSEEEFAAIEQILIPINTPSLFVADPDGNVIEVQNQEGSELV